VIQSFEIEKMKWDSGNITTIAALYVHGATHLLHEHDKRVEDNMCCVHLCMCAAYPLAVPFTLTVKQTDRKRSRINNSTQRPAAAANAVKDSL
jgi:hypothetical protein